MKNVSEYLLEEVVLTFSSFFKQQNNKQQNKKKNQLKWSLDDPMKEAKKLDRANRFANKPSTPNKLTLDIPDLNLKFVFSNLC